jgi:preprotein translocase subunit YajC
VNGGFLLILLVMFAFMYLLLIRPQRQAQRRQADMLSAVKPGDEVVTVGGIYGDVTEVEGDRVRLLIAEDVEIEVAKRAIASVVPPDEAAAEDEHEAEAEELEPVAADDGAQGETRR